MLKRRLPGLLSRADGGADALRAPPVRERFPLSPFLSGWFRRQATGPLDVTLHGLGVVVNRSRVKTQFYEHAAPVLAPGRAKEPARLPRQGEIPWMGEHAIRGRKGAGP
ncbi:MAG: hypothetical protein ACFCGT_23650 [Sandaracinaceae bacterium]